MGAPSMASPLLLDCESAIDAPAPETVTRSNAYEVHTYTVQSESPLLEEGEDDSSPFVSCVDVKPTLNNQENISPTKSQHSRVRSGTELSPLRILSEKHVSDHGLTSKDTEMGPPRLPRSPRKMSPVKRFPVKVSNPLDMPPPPSPELQPMSLDDAMKENEGLKHAIDIFEDEKSMHEDQRPPITSDEHDDEPAGPDDTMISTFSTFSAVPNMTMFAKLDQSPEKFSQAGSMTPRSKQLTPLSETSRRAGQRESGNTSNLLMDFTESLRRPSRSPAKHGSRAMTDMSGTPNRRLSNLLDFDIPPMPTPRSVPSITARELESLKSNFLSEISSLKASLSGKEAEVLSLKTAVGDAEKRVGESLEQLREEKLSKQQLVAEREDWEKRGREFETVLRSVKEEMMNSEKEREELEQKFDESEKRREAAELLHQEAESKMAGMRAGRDSEKASPEKPKGQGQNSNQEVEMAVERVARELHGLYKSKHETKVAALKKSYESRWQKKVKELEERIEELREENDRLRCGHDADVTRIESGNTEAGELKAKAVKDSTAMQELKADIQRLEAVVETVQRDNGDLRSMLERERVEKGELVQLAEEMMSMQHSFVGQSAQECPPSQPRHSTQTREQEQPHPEAPVAKTPKTSREGFKSASSVSRTSSLRAPGSALRQPLERNKSGGGLPRPGGVPRSGIMSSIEKMGSYRGRGGE